MSSVDVQFINYAGGEEGGTPFIRTIYPIPLRLINSA